MRKYEVDRVHNSKDDEIYQIAQSVEQKVRTGMLMPDYEMGQKPFHHWGDVILNYVSPWQFCELSTGMEVVFINNDENDWFQSTFQVKEVGNDGNGYVTEIWVDHQCMKTYCNASSLQINSVYYAVEFTHLYSDGVDLEFYDEPNGEWVHVDYSTMDEHNGNFTETNFMINVPQDGDNCCVRIRGDYGSKMIRVRSSVGYLKVLDNHVKGFVRFEISKGNVGKGIILYKNKSWIYIENPHLHDICVKHGGMKYVGEREKTIYKITNKNTKFDFLYYGYHRLRYGAGQQYQNRRKRKSRMGWIYCDFLTEDMNIQRDYSFSEILIRLNRRRKNWRRGSAISATKQVHVVKVNKINNCFELWKLIVNNYGQHGTFIKPIFSKTIPLDVAWKLHDKKYANKIINV